MSFLRRWILRHKLPWQHVGTGGKVWDIDLDAEWCIESDSEPLARFRRAVEDRLKDGPGVQGPYGLWSKLFRQDEKVCEKDIPISSFSGVSASKSRDPGTMEAFATKAWEHRGEYEPHCPTEIVKSLYDRYRGPLPAMYLAWSDRLLFWCNDGSHRFGRLYWQWMANGTDTRLKCTLNAKWIDPDAVLRLQRYHLWAVEAPFGHALVSRCRRWPYPRPKELRVHVGRPGSASKPATKADSWVIVSFLRESKDAELIAESLSAAGGCDLVARVSMLTAGMGDPCKRFA